MIAEAEVQKVNNVEQPHGVEEHIPDVWDAHHVGVRLVDAFKVLDRTKKPRGPREPGGAWPAYQYEWADRLAWAEQTEAEQRDREQQQNRVSVPPTAIELRNMEVALDWLRWLRTFDEGYCVQLTAWAVRSSKGKSVRELCQTRGWSFQNFYRRIGKAKTLLAGRLNSTSLPVF